ncbi:hypothetical protein [Roseivirga seohaensis]|uniref:hypothetical protein n=1 Tax=Roseivirga seohaensis TaxID=1914963 RepID=UPI003BABF86D
MTLGGIVRRQKHNRYGNSQPQRRETRATIAVNDDVFDEDLDNEREEIEYHSRAFLNPPNATSPAAIFTSIEGAEMQIKINDCSNHIRLHSWINGDSALYKIETLITELQKLKDQLIEIQANKPVKP